MAEKRKKAVQQTYPMLPVGHWWALRKKFKQSIPGIVTNGYLATVLKMGANSARANVLPYLKTLGIIDDEGKTLDRAKQWRGDGRYPSVCKEILKEAYPPELLEAVTDSAQREEAKAWFAHATGTGEAAVKRMVALYMVLLEADASKEPEPRAERARPAKKSEKKSENKPAPVVQVSDRQKSRNVLVPVRRHNLRSHPESTSTCKFTSQRIRPPTR